MRELTDYQKDPLIKLAKLQETVPHVILFLPTVSGISAVNEDYEIPHPGPGIIDLWEDANYIQVMRHMHESRTFGSTTSISFILTKEGIDYANFTQKPKIIQKFILGWNKLFSDIPSFFWGVLGALVIWIITKILENIY